MKLKFAPFCSSRDALSDGILFHQKPWTIVHGFIFGSPKKVLIIVCHLNRYKERNLMAFISAAWHL